MYSIMSSNWNISFSVSWYLKLSQLILILTLWAICRLMHHFCFRKIWFWCFTVETIFVSLHHDFGSWQNPSLSILKVIFTERGNDFKALQWVTEHGSVLCQEFPFHPYFFLGSSLEMKWVPSNSSSRLVPFSIKRKIAQCYGNGQCFCRISCYWWYTVCKIEHDLLLIPGVLWLSSHLLSNSLCYLLYLWCNALSLIKTIFPPYIVTFVIFAENTIFFKCRIADNSIVLLLDIYSYHVRPH